MKCADFSNSLYLQFNTRPKRTVSTSATNKNLKDTVRQTSKTSVWRLPLQTHLSRTTTHRLLKAALPAFLKDPVHQSLMEADCEERVACQWLKQKCNSSESFTDNIWFSDESHFLLNGQYRAEHPVLGYGSTGRNPTEAPALAKINRVVRAKKTSLARFSLRAGTVTR